MMSIFLTKSPQACGVMLLSAGFYLFTDPPRILMSRLLCAGSQQLSDLPQPLFYYVALGLAGAGAVALLASMIGWWVVCLNTYFMLSLVSFDFDLLMYLLILNTIPLVLPDRYVPVAARILSVSDAYDLAALFGHIDGRNGNG